MKKSKLITFVLALALVVTSIFAVAVVAGAADEVKLPTIAGKNLYYEANTSIAVKVSYEGTLSAGAKLGILVWDKATYDGTAATVIHKSFEPRTVNDMTGFYLTQPVEAGNLSYPYMIAAAIDNGDGTYTIGETQECSVVKYAYQKLGEKNTLVETSRVCQTLIKYAAAADNVITNTANVAQFGYIKAVGGTVNAFSTFGGINGKSVVLRADAKNSDGKYFAGWTVDGVLVSTERVLVATVPADAIGAVEYVATYTDTGVGFLRDAEGVTMSPGAGKYIKVDVAGNKYALVDEEKNITGGSINALADKTGIYTEASADISTASRTVGEATQAITVGVYLNGSTVEVPVRLNMTCRDGDRLTFYMDNGVQHDGFKDYILDANGNEKSVGFVANQLINITFKANTEANGIDMYVDGEFFETITIERAYTSWSTNTSGYLTKRKEVANLLGIVTFATSESANSDYRAIYATDDDGNKQLLYKNGTFTYQVTETVVSAAGTTTIVTEYKYEAGKAVVETKLSEVTDESKTGDAKTTRSYKVTEVVDFGTPAVDITSITMGRVMISSMKSSSDDLILYEANFR